MTEDESSLLKSDAENLLESEREFLKKEAEYYNGNKAKWIQFQLGAKGGKVGDFQIPFCDHCDERAPIIDINGKAYIVLKKKCPCCKRKMSKSILISEEPFIIDETKEVDTDE